MSNVWVYEVSAELSDDVAHYVYTDEATCRAEALARVDNGERVRVREYERMSGGFVTLYARAPRPGACTAGYATLGEAHATGERGVHGWAPLT